MTRSTGVFKRCHCRNPVTGWLLGVGCPLLDTIRLHDLRHGAAGLSLAAGNGLNTVQAMLGHASIVLTADTYTSVLPSLARQSAEATARLRLVAANTTGRRLRIKRRRPPRSRRAREHRIRTIATAA